MDPARFYVAPEYAPIVTLLDSILSELNVGLLMFHVEDTGDAASLRLIYANREAMRSTGIDMESRVGKSILDAFPPLAGSGVPETYLEVANTRRSRRLDVPYGENGETRANYSVRAFPMPGSCVGVLFEREEP